MLNYIIINIFKGDVNIKNIYYVYIHTNKINNKKYVGITKQNPEKRWGNNGNNYKSSPHFYQAIQKYGWNNFKHLVIASQLTQEEACKMEKELIKKYNTQNRKFGYNILEGGIAPQLPQEVKNKISKALKGNKNGLGKKCSEEKKRKISLAQKGRKLTEEHKVKLRKPKSITHPCSKETREKIIANKKDKKAIICIETGIEYESIQECARQLNLYATNICKVLKGKIKTTGGFHFKYKNNDDI